MHFDIVTLSYIISIITLLATVYKIISFLSVLSEKVQRHDREIIELDAKVYDIYKRGYNK